MKMNFKLIKCLILLFLISNISENFGANCSKSTMSASFKSNYKLMLEKNKTVRRGSENVASSASTSASSSASSSASTSIASSNYSLSVKSTESSSDSVATGFLSKKRKLLVPEIPILFEGWAKYFNYIDKGNTKPSNFFINDEYDHLSQEERDSKEKDKYGSTNIPGETYFYAVVFQDSVQFFTNRKDATRKVHDIIHLDFITAIPEDKPYNGGVLNYGEMKEGSCLQIKTIAPVGYFKMDSSDPHPAAGLNTVWFVCMDEKKDKEFFMELIINMKIQKQRQMGIYMSAYKSEQLNQSSSSQMSVSSSSSSSSLSIENRTFGSSEESIEIEINGGKRNGLDGYWKVLQAWSSCTVKCGGGTQTVQLMCIPPKKGGKNCVGEAIRTKLCNPQPCPEMQVLKEYISNESSSSSSFGLGEKVEKAIVKVMSMSSRPQRYDKCYLKDGDALIETTDKETGKIVNLPVRLVMNNKSIAVFTDDTLQSNMKSYLLENTVFTRVKDNEHCFFLKGVNNEDKFCQLDINTEAFVEEWGYDFNLFKNQCRQERRTAKFEEEKLEEEYKDGLVKLKQDMIQKKVVNTKKIVQKTEETELHKKVETTEKLSLEAIQKEVKLEEMLEREEEEKEKKEEEELQIQIEVEKKKHDCFLKSVKEKEMEDQLNVEKLRTEEKIRQIQEKARREISIKRVAMTKKLSEMRLKKERKKRELQKQIMSIRLEMSSKFNNLSKLGDASHCKDLTTVEKKSEYCNNKVEADEQLQCVNNAKSESYNNKTFCQYCCENEIGELHLKEREKCFQEVCEGISDNKI